MVDAIAREEKRTIRSVNGRTIDEFHVLGKVNEGTFGVVYKAIRMSEKPDYEKYKHSYVDMNKITFMAIKKPKNNAREGEGFNKDAVREIALLNELKRGRGHENIVTLREVILCPDGTKDSKGLYLVFDWAEFELSEILKSHRERQRMPLCEKGVKSIMWQLLNGISYIHENWIIHRDLKPANILIMGRGPQCGRVKIADFGMARVFQQPLRGLNFDGVVVTVWYRAPELLLGAKHYSKAIDLWAVGCIFGELLSNPPGPLFQGQEDKTFQRDQLEKIFRVMGKPSATEWHQITELPDWPKISNVQLAPDKNGMIYQGLENKIPVLKHNTHALDLLKKLLNFDPAKRITALQAMEHPYFGTGDFNPTSVWREQTNPMSVGLDIAAYAHRNIHPVGMNGQAAMPAQNMQSSIGRGMMQQQQQQGHNMMGVGQKRGGQVNLGPAKMQRK
uniref:Cyclin-dependent kinase 8 n=1 Tax=Guillardia theta TaxID=55529 RepID=A0A7S4K5C2_GUITH|mmetsp:Transcript_21225/g.70451  ORF Transcript_21225/g.70451 Transcript_21225/m.70451 type:complete len:447 (+) Transcript_21225:206-1546(+)